MAQTRLPCGACQGRPNYRRNRKDLQMIKNSDIIVIVLAAIMMLLILPRLNIDNSRYVNCSTVEFNPDFTPAMREACRQARSGYVNRSKP
jgi:hypothetical protein